MDAPSELEKPALRDHLSPVLQLANVLAVMIPTAVFSWIVGRLPASVPAHWNAAGQVDRWGTPHEQWLFLGFMIFDWAMLVVVCLTVAKERWVLPDRDAVRFAGLERRRRTLIIRMMEWLMLVLNAGFGAVWMLLAFGSLPGEMSRMHDLILPASGVMLVASLAAVIVPLFPLVRIQKELRAITGGAVLGTRPDGWKAGGSIYFAPDDPAVFVPKKLGIGQTLNFARPASWLFLAAVLVVPILITLFVIAMAD